MKKSLSGGIKTFSFGQDLVFEAFIQFKVDPSARCGLDEDTGVQEYIGFVKAMNAMKGMKLCYKDRDSEKAWNSNIKVQVVTIVTSGTSDTSVTCGTITALCCYGTRIDDGKDNLSCQA